MLKIRLTIQFFAATAGKLSAVSFCCAFVLAVALSASAQEPQLGQTQSPASPPATSPAPGASQQPVSPAPPAAEPAPAASPEAAPAPQAPAPPGSRQADPTAAKDSPQSESIREEEIKRLLVGKPLYLRGGYLD